MSTISFDKKFGKHHTVFPLGYVAAMHLLQNPILVYLQTSVVFDSEWIGLHDEYILIRVIDVHDQLHALLNRHVAELDQAENYSKLSYTYELRWSSMYLT